MLGLGAMGLLFTQLLPHFTGAERVAAGRRSTRLELARQFGAVEVYDVNQAPLLEQIDSRQHFDCVWNAPAISPAGRRPLTAPYRTARSCCSGDYRAAHSSRSIAIGCTTRKFA